MALPCLMNYPCTFGAVLALGMGLSGCVSSGTHEQTLADLAMALKAAAQQAESDNRSLAE